MYGPPGPNIAAILGPTPVMAFRASVEAEKWTRKDEADYAVSLSLVWTPDPSGSRGQKGLGFRLALAIG